MKEYKKNAILFEGLVSRELKGDEESNRPEHDQNICYVVHPIIVDELQLFVGSRNEKQPKSVINFEKWAM